MLVCCRFAVFGLLLSLCAQAQAAALTWDQDGGDIWAFHRQVSGDIAGASCATMDILGPAGDFPATITGNHFAAEIAFLPGRNRLVARCRRPGAAPLLSEAQSWRVRLRDVPKAWATVRPDGGEILLDGSGSEKAAGRAAAILHHEWRAASGNPEALHPVSHPIALDRASVDAPTLRLRVPRRDGRYGVVLRVVDALGRGDESTVIFDVKEGAAVAVDPAHDRPPWAEDAVVYGAVPQLLGSHGLAAVTRRLDRIAALGATALWLSPITVSPPGDFGYAVTDHFHIRGALGNAADLHALVRAAHARGLKVLLDIPANDLSDLHPYYRDALSKGQRSAYADFFARDDTGAVTHYFDWRNLENLDLGDAEVRRYVIEAFAFWLREFDVDGFRVDAAWGIRQRAPDFWPQWRAELKRIKPDILLIAEASERDSYYGDNGFDAAYDWTDRLGEWAWHDAFDGPGIAARLRAALAREHRGPLVFRFLDNNDTGQRFLSRHGAALTRLATLLLMTLPGLPCVYMGEEAGAAFEPYKAHAPIAWPRNEEWRNFYTHAIALRHAEPALRTDRLTLLTTERGDDVLAYLRDGAASTAPLLVLLNFSGEAASVVPHGDPRLAELVASGRVIDELGGEAISIDPKAPRFELPPFTARVLRPAPAR